MQKERHLNSEAVYRFAKDQLEKETGAYSKGWNNGLKVMMSAARNKDAIPSADVKPVIRGVWLDENKPDEYRPCSVCGHHLAEFIFPTETMTVELTPFCPFCGADLRGTRK